MISPQYVDGLELRIKELTAERDALAAHKMAVHKLTGLPASVGVCEPIEGFAERPQDLVPAVRDMALRIKDLETSLARRDEYKRLSDQYSDLWRVERGKAIALAAHVENLHEFLKTAPIGSGVCCCGDDIARHADPMSCGHSPVDEVVYSAGLLMDQAPKTSLAKLKAQWQAEALEGVLTCCDKCPPGKSHKDVLRVVDQMARAQRDLIRRQAGGEE